MSRTTSTSSSAQAGVVLVPFEPSDVTDFGFAAVLLVSGGTVALIGWYSTSMGDNRRYQPAPLVVSGAAGTIVTVPGVRIRRVLASGSTPGIALLGLP